MSTNRAEHWPTNRPAHSLVTEGQLAGRPLTGKHTTQQPSTDWPIKSQVPPSPYERRFCICAICAVRRKKTGEKSWRNQEESHPDIHRRHEDCRSSANLAADFAWITSPARQLARLQAAAQAISLCTPSGVLLESIWTAQLAALWVGGNCRLAQSLFSAS